MNELSITQKYPVSQFNLLGNTDVIVQIPDIKSPVIQQIKLDAREGAGDIYLQQRASKAWTDQNGRHHPATPNKYAITKNGLKKLADGAGIKMISSEHVWSRQHARNALPLINIRGKWCSAEIAKIKMLHTKLQYRFRS